jgi:deoxyribose-phosphate aldolase
MEVTMDKKYEVFTQKDFTVKEMAALIDYSLLVPYTSQNEMKQFLKNTKDYGFKVACVNNCYTELAAIEFSGTDITVATVAAFPFGALTPQNKAAEVLIGNWHTRIWLCVWKWRTSTIS